MKSLNFQSKESVILIGGAPTTGKSTFAQELSLQMGCPWISTDTIKKIMKATSFEIENPHLYRRQLFSPSEYFSRFSIDEIVQGEFERAEIIWKGVIAIIKDSYPLRSFIIEGSAITPALIDSDLRANKKIHALFLQSSTDWIEKIIMFRGLYDTENLYPKAIKEKEIEWVNKYQSKIIEQAKRLKYQIVEGSDVKRDVKEFLTRHKNCL